MILGKEQRERERERERERSAKKEKRVPSEKDWKEKETGEEGDKDRRNYSREEVTLYSQVRQGGDNHDDRTYGNIRGHSHALQWNRSQVVS